MTSHCGSNERVQRRVYGHKRKGGGRGELLLLEHTRIHFDERGSVKELRGGDMMVGMMGKGHLKIQITYTRHLRSHQIDPCRTDKVLTR